MKVVSFGCFGCCVLFVWLCVKRRLLVNCSFGVLFDCEVKVAFGCFVRLFCEVKIVWFGFVC